MPAIHSRCEQGRMCIEKLDKNEFTARVATVLVTENIEFDLDTLDIFIEAKYPDLRKCLHMTQVNSITGKLVVPNEDTQDTKDWLVDAIELFNDGKINEARAIMCSQVTTENVEDMFVWLYNNTHIWSDTIEGQDRAIICIRDAMAKIPLMAVQEVNISATLAQLAQIKNNKEN